MASLNAIKPQKERKSKESQDPWYAPPPEPIESKKLDSSLGPTRSSCQNRSLVTPSRE